MRTAIIVGLALLQVRAAPAQSQPDLIAVLGKISQIYKAATQYEFIGLATCRARPLGTIQSFHILIAFQAPGKYRMEAGNPCLGPGSGDMGDALMVHDGGMLWAYFPKMNQYSSIPANALAADVATGDAGDMRPEMVDNFTMWRYRGIADVADKARFIREDTITSGAARILCYVVVVPPQQHLTEQTWWIDKVTYHVLRIDDDQSSAVFTTVKLNEPLPDALFKFTPPPDAKMMEPDQ